MAVIVVLVCVAGAVFASRGKLFQGLSQLATGTRSTNVSSSSDAPLASDTNWTLNLANVTVPDRSVAGRINGQVFHSQRVILKDGALAFRQGLTVPPDLALTIVLAENNGWALAGKSFSIETNSDEAFVVLLRWKDAQHQLVKHYIRGGYALRLDFGRALADCLPGTIHFCAPDEAKSYVVGKFEAEIFLPSPPQPPRPPEKRKRKR